ncbi:MAG: hypothetical protein F6J93_06260 [Oscillatoria sp. SIO1A7]|nr:hypothetical protein [Oscillatoria sp. SIO1A7]
MSGGSYKSSFKIANKAQKKAIALEGVWVVCVGGRRIPSIKKSDRRGNCDRFLRRATRATRAIAQNLKKKAIALPAIGERDRAIAFSENRKPRF